MSDAEKIKQLEARVAEVEFRLRARVEAAVGIVSSQQALVCDALALLACMDRPLVERLLKVRRLQMQNDTLPPDDRIQIERKMLIDLYERALSQAVLLSESVDLRPR